MSQLVTMSVELGFVQYDNEDAGLQLFALNWEVRQNLNLMNQVRVLFLKKKTPKIY